MKREVATEKIGKEGAIKKRKERNQKGKERSAEVEGATTYWNEERASYRR
jgi:hypothetical protein